MNKDTNDSTEKQDNEHKADSKIEKLIKLVTANKEIELFHDELFDPYARFPAKSGTTTGQIRGKSFGHFLAHLAYKKVGFPISKEIHEKVIATLEAVARFDGDQYQLSIRSAINDKCIWYDLGSKAVQITGNGWTIIENPPNLFRKYSQAKTQVAPERGGNLDDLLALFNLPDSALQLLLKAFIVSAFIPDIPHPILAIHGAQGSGKTTLFKFLIRLLDPCAIEDVPYYEIKEFLQSAAHRWVVPLDNLSKVPERLSDILCKLSTGSGFSKRQLYTDDDDVILHLRRVVILNGVNLPIHKPDALDRCIIMGLERISAEKRKTEAELLVLFDEKKGKLLGACFDILSAAMKIYPTLKLNNLPRMADFSRWGCAIAEAMGNSSDEFIKAYDKNISMQSVEALDASPLAQTIFVLCSKYHSFEGTPQRLLEELRPFVRAGDEKFFPNTPRQLGRKLTEITPPLISLGYIVERKRGDERWIKIMAPPKSEINVGNDETSAGNGVSRHDDVTDVKSRNSTGDLPPFDQFDGKW